MFFPSNIDKEKIKYLVRTLKSPTGTFALDISYDNGIFDKTKGKLTLIRIPSGETAIILEREDNLDVNFVYSSPGTGTRIATVNIESLKPNCRFRIILQWSPDKISLDMGVVGGVFLKSKECKIADYGIVVGTDGSICQVGSKGVQVKNLFVMINGKTIFENPAIKNWQDNLEAIKILQTGTSTEGYVYTSLVSCVSIIVKKDF